MSSWGLADLMLISCTLGSRWTHPGTVTRVCRIRGRCGWRSARMYLTSVCRTFSTFFNDISTDCPICVQLPRLCSVSPPTQPIVAWLFVSERISFKFVVVSASCFVNSRESLLDVASRWETTPNHSALQPTQRYILNHCIIASTPWGKAPSSLGVSPNVAARGRPLGFLVAWLARGLALAARTDHVSHGALFIPLEERRLARASIVGTPGAEELFAHERPQRPGEEPEPHGLC